MPKLNVINFHDLCYQHDGCRHGGITVVCVWRLLQFAKFVFDSVTVAMLLLERAKTVGDGREDLVGKADTTLV